MSASSSTVIHVDCSELSLYQFVEMMGNRGWKPQTQVMHLALAGDQFDWDFSAASELSSVLQQLDNRRSFGGIVLWDDSGENSGSFVIDWMRNQIQILWGADCPRDPELPRVVECGWIMTEVRAITTLLPARPSRIEISYVSP